MQTMTKGTDQGTAKIYQFPLRGRFATSIHRADLTKLQRADNIAEWVKLCEQVRKVSAPSGGDDAKAAPLLAPQPVYAALGGGWYHDEAIQEAKRAHKD